MYVSGHGPSFVRIMIDMCACCINFIAVFYAEWVLV